MKTCFAVAFLLLLLSVWQGDAREVTTGSFPQSHLSFIENAGQITDQHYNLRKDIDYKLNAPGMDIFVGDGQIHYQWSKSLSVPVDKTTVKQTRSEESKVAIYRMDVELVGANKNARVITEEPQDYYERYYLAHTGENGAEAHSYNKITYKDIYPNIDWVLYTQDKQLKYDFVVRPGGNVADIQLKYAGATSLQLEDGDLTAATPFGSIMEQKPYSYEAGSKKKINSAFLLQDGVLSFGVDNYMGTLIIDPYLAWATYYGGNNYTRGTVPAPDLAGNVYMFGETTSTSNIATTGTHQLNLSGNYDAYIAKFNGSGQLLWGTYYGGTGDESSAGLCYDATTDAVYITGWTSSTSGISTPGSYQPIYGGSSSDAYIGKFSSNGLRLWGTYYGGNSFEQGGDLSVDKNGNIYLVGVTSSSSGIATPGSLQPIYAGAGTANFGDGFIVKFDNIGNRVWGTYYGGADDDGCYGVVSDLQGNIYVSGGTNSSMGIATAGSHQPIYGGGNALGSNRDGFLTKLNSSGARLWATYYGGSNNERCWRLAIDNQENLYISGITNSTSAIATTGSWQSVYGGGAGDAFLVKFNNAGVRQWGTYYGGTGEDNLVNVTFDHARNLYLGGYSSSTTGMTTPGSHQTAFSGSVDALLVKFTPGGQRLWGSYLGGVLSDHGLIIASDTSGNIYMTGQTASTTNIATPGSHQPNLIGTNNAFLAKFQSEDTLVYIKPEFADSLLCPGDTIHVPYGITHAFRSNNNFFLQLSNAAGSFASPTNLVVTNNNLAGTLAAIIPYGTAGGNGYRIRIVASGPADTTPVRNVTVKAGPAKPTANSNTPVCTGQPLNLLGGSTTGGVSYSWTGPGSYSASGQLPVRNNATMAMAGDYILKTLLNGCTSQADTATVVIHPSPAAPVAGSNSPICAGTSLNLTASLVPGTSYSWNGPGAFTSNQQNPVINPAATNAAGTYTVNVTDGNGCVSANATTTVVINNSNAPTVGVFPNPNDSVCPGAMVTFIAVPNNGGTPAYQWYKNTLQIPGATNATYMTNTVSTGDFYSVAMTSTAVCAVPATVNSNNVIMTVVPPVVPSVTISASPGLNVGPWRMITFTATPVNGGSSPTYQWLRNGQAVIGAVSNTWGANNLSDNDVISVVLFSSEVCAIPPTDTSNTQLVHINLGIVDHNNNTANIQLYPNPNNGDFTIKGDLSQAVSIEVVNAIGQVVFSSRLAVGSRQSFAYPIHLDVASGVYLLKVAGEKGVEMVRFRVE